MTDFHRQRLVKTLTNRGGWYVVLIASLLASLTLFAVGWIVGRDLFVVWVIPATLPTTTLSLVAILMYRQRRRRLANG